jgi:glyoxylase-like metal-dependent hydrolase (beta-lactamase superfamily II)
MCEEILPNLFRIKIPLPESPLKYLNSYIIRDDERNLIIDTGLNRKECLDAMLSGLKKLGVELTQSDIFITHLHADHFGLVAKLVSDSSNILFSRPEKELLESWEGFDTMVGYAANNGFPENQLKAAMDKHPGNKYGTDWIPELKVLEDGDTINVGDYHFKCVATPGHTMGHICLYEPAQKVLIAGDHILIDITPNIQCWSDTQNPLKHYLESLDKVSKLDINLVLPGHRRLIEDHHARINELKEHHKNRLNEVLDILSAPDQHAFQIASQMSWDLVAKSWDHFPVAQCHRGGYLAFETAGRRRQGQPED